MTRNLLTTRAERNARARKKEPCPYCGHYRYLTPANRIREWFLANPGEMLLTSDAVAKFDLKKHQVLGGMGVLERKGIVKHKVGPYNTFEWMLA